MSVISDEKHLTVSQGDEITETQHRKRKRVKNHVEGVFLVASKAEKGNSHTAGFNKIGSRDVGLCEIPVRNMEMGSE